jgi:hypothetical protein
MTGRLRQAEPVFSKSALVWRAKSVANDPALNITASDDPALFGRK